MNNNYQYKITFKLNEPFDVNFVNEYCNKYPNAKILVEVQNTKGITSDMIRRLNPNVGIRVAGGYDEDRIRRHGNLHFRGGETGEYYTSAVIYTRNETVKILEEIEKIEAGLNKNWSDIQKSIYIYDKLKAKIMYDPKFEEKKSREIRSLRGLISKQSVCAGYAMIFKEFMDRNNIECEYVEGYTEIDKNGKMSSGHAWNILTIEGKKYPIDLTWDNTRFRKGKSYSFDWLGKDVKEFSERHHPAPGEKTQDYMHTLSQIDEKVLRQMYLNMGMGRSKDYQSTTYTGKRKDGSKYIVAQIGENTINNSTYYRYYYVEIGKDGKRQLPLILYSDTNITYTVNSRKYNKPCYSKEYEEAIDNILFSKENIADSIARKTYYIGGVEKESSKNKTEVVTSYREIAKPDEKKKLFVYPTKRYVRSDGSIFIAQQMYEKPHKINDTNVMRYDIFELVKENGQEVLKRNTVFTEKNFFKDKRQSMVDIYLSRSRLDRKVKEAGGYIGYYGEDGNKYYDPNLVKFFETSKRQDISSISRSMKKPDADKPFQLPQFSELKSLAKKYKIELDPNNFFDSDISKVKVVDIKTGQVQSNQNIRDKAILANLWLSAAGVKVYQDEARPGEIYAFNEPAEELYNTICQKLTKDCEEKGVIDTVDLFKNIENDNLYKYNREIIVKLFKTPSQAEFINKLVLKSLGANKQYKKPDALYTMSYAGELAYNSKMASVI
jgi:hypothetical protein